MAQRKKLQVFVSSTYVDLKEERQAAVEAILTAGHIPAGMELFAAGDESQMNVIKRWIDESDVYMLILGGRYGSVEPASGKSYIHLEYEYALQRGMPLFAIVIDDDHLEQRVLRMGTAAIERENPQKLKEFQALVRSRMVRFWRDPRDIKLSVLETLTDFLLHRELTGWIPGSEAVDTAALTEEIARLARENAELRKQIEKLSAETASFGGATFEELKQLLSGIKADLAGLTESSDVAAIHKVAEAFGDPEPTLLHQFWMLSGLLKKWADFLSRDQYNFPILSTLEDFGLLERKDDGLAANAPGFHSFRLTDAGKKFLLRLRLDPKTQAAEAYVFR
jgi:hypothetical protein